MSCEEKMIDGVWNINFNGRWYVMSDIGLQPTLDDGEEKVEDGVVWIKWNGCWYPGEEARLDYFPFAELDNDEFLDLYMDYDDDYEEPVRYTAPVHYYDYIMNDNTWNLDEC
jgi:hypothetical protein